jgi:hypothetical protein
VDTRLEIERSVGVPEIEVNQTQFKASMAMV